VGSEKDARLAPMLGAIPRRARAGVNSPDVSPTWNAGDSLRMNPSHGDDLTLPERSLVRGTATCNGPNEPPRWDLPKKNAKPAILRRSIKDHTVLSTIKRAAYPSRPAMVMLKSWTERIIRMRKEVPEIWMGMFHGIEWSRDPAVLALR